MNCSIAHFYNLAIGDVEDLPVTLYRTMFEQVLNITALYRGSEFRYETADDEYERKAAVVKHFKQQGLL